MWLYICCILVMNFFPHFTTGQVRPVEAQLVDTLLKNYSKKVKPTLAIDDQIDIEIAFILARIKNLDERNQVMTSFGLIQMSWYDESLLWDPRLYGGATQIIVPANNLWLPEITLLNGLNDGTDLGISSNFRVEVHANGLVNWIPGFQWITTCNVELFYFPFDTQTCTIRFVSWVYGENLLNFTVVSRKVILDNYEISGEWNLVDTNAWWQRLEGPSFRGESFPIVQFSVTLQRNAAYFVIHIVVPCVTLTFVHILVFLLPPESGEKVSLGITVMLAYSVFLLMVSDVTPRSGSAIPLISVFITLSMTMTALSVMMTVLVLYLHHHSPDKPAPRWLHQLISCLARIVCMQGFGKDTTKTIRPLLPDKMKLESLEEVSQKVAFNDVPKGWPLSPEIIKFIENMMVKERETEVVAHNKQDWIDVARVLDRFFLVISVVVAFLATMCLLIILKSGKAN